MRKFARRLLSTAIAVCVAAMPLSATAVQIEDFQDIPSQPWYYDYLSRATDLGLFSGTSSTTFSPEREITRAEAVVVLSRVHERLTGTEIEASSAAAFQDVSSRSYYSKAVNWAAENKIVSGYGNRTFRPGGTITHGELAVMFHNYLRLVQKDSLYPPEEQYADYEDIPSWARPHVQAISGFDIFQGKAFAPQARTTRSEVVSLFVRMYEKAAYPTDTKTLRQKYVYILSADENGNFPDFLPLGEEHNRIISSYEEYAELLSLYQGLADFQEITQATPLEVTEKSFAENNLLAVEVQREGAPAFDCEFAGIDMDVDSVRATLIESGLGGSTADKKGFIFFVLVPKNIKTAELTQLSWTEDTEWVPA